MTSMLDPCANCGVARGLHTSRRDRSGTACAHYSADAKTICDRCKQTLTSVHELTEDGRLVCSRTPCLMAEEINRKVEFVPQEQFRCEIKFPTTQTTAKREHVAWSCAGDPDSCGRAYCAKHEGSLFVCAVCNQAESELEPECPGPSVPPVIDGRLS